MTQAMGPYLSDSHRDRTDKEKEKKEQKKKEKS